MMKREVFTNVSFRGLSHGLKEGIVGVWRNRMMSLASIASVTAALLILGIVMIMVLNINNIGSTSKNQFREVIVDIEDSVNMAGIEALGDRILALPGIDTLTFQTKEQALALMKTDWQEEAYLLDGLPQNPLPNSYKIILKDISDTDQVVSALVDMPEIEGVRYYKDIVEKLIKVTVTIRNVGIILMIILVLISIFIIFNTIKITVFARQTEISIMKYVGATNNFIRGPFIVEGIVLGFIGSTLSILIILYAYKMVYHKMLKDFYSFFTVYLVPYYSIVNDVMIIFFTIGIGVGILGSVLSLKRFLRV